MSKQNAGVWVGLIILVFSSVIFIQAMNLDYFSKFGPGPGLFPIWLSGILLVLSILYIRLSIKKSIYYFSDIIPMGRSFGNILSVVLALIVFMVLVNFTGFIIASTVLLFTLFSREYKWYWGLGIAIFTSIILFIIFKVFFEIPLPVSVFGW
ncbi:tripartite tricarboxylate transporter TctB family protein [Paenisporosarcina indica]|uniref:tripartite tricarboxylate transporter TctB family protein n=1 Tax=Paenisporosarcina indica TaxID=650093 RepID=UPI0009502019|nr:tripartite tricarboxylate transporter TctB family protein [Paenisporosarcina indica]